MIYIIILKVKILIWEDINKLKEEIIEVKKRLNELEKNNNNIEDNLKGFTNKIIKNKDEVKKLLNWIDPNEKYRVKLIYDATLEENTNNDFHKKCDGKGSTIIFIESSNGKRFGGYTRISWNNNIKNYMTDASAFLFSFDNDKKYKVIKPNYAIYGDDRYGPHFVQHMILHKVIQVVQNFLLEVHILPIQVIIKLMKLETKNLVGMIILY